MLGKSGKFILWMITNPLGTLTNFKKKKTKLQWQLLKLQAHAEDRTTGVFFLNSAM
jgi:hypothetical protein